MKKVFYPGLLGLLLFEIANVYFIMPMPGSQQINSLGVAYFLYQWRWAFRILFGLILVYGLIKSDWKPKRWQVVMVLVTVGFIYFLNFQMAADHLFYQPKTLLMQSASINKVDSDRLVLGVVINDEAKAYPIRMIGYHHLVPDTVGGKSLLITYCTVCRSGRIYEPIVNGRQEHFRLVGMDHFNAMMEDVTTRSWWRQATGEAIKGKLKGTKLPEVLSTQISLAKWLQLYPASLVMQEDPHYKNEYDTSLQYESGKSKKTLTGTDSLSWKDKSWIVGIEMNGQSKAYDWNQLKEKRVIEDVIAGKHIAIVLADDDKSFVAFEKPDGDATLSFQNDIITLNHQQYRLNGKGVTTANHLKRVIVYQEFWHSWRTFHPATTTYP